MDPKYSRHRNFGAPYRDLGVEPMNDFEIDPLWIGIREFQLDEPAAEYPYSTRLAKENYWPNSYAKRVIEEYKKFCYLGMVAGHPVSPSDPVDQAWHLHILSTHSYWNEFCEHVLGGSFHHAPNRGGDKELVKFKDCYARTLSSYRRIFGTTPPTNIWAPAEIHFKRLATYRKINKVTHWVVRKPWWLIAT